MENLEYNVYSAMQTGKPFASYKKTILAKVYVQILNPFTDQPEGVILHGNPKTDDDAIIDVWNEKQDLFFKRMNKRMFETGMVIKIDRPTVAEEAKSIEQYSDAELKEVVNMRYISLQKILSDITSEAVVYRMLELSREMEKSDKIVKSIEARLAYLQQNNINK